MTSLKSFVGANLSEPIKWCWCNWQLFQRIKDSHSAGITVKVFLVTDWVTVFIYGLNKICGRQPLKSLRWYGLRKQKWYILVRGNYSFISLRSWSWKHWLILVKVVNMVFLFSSVRESFTINVELSTYNQTSFTIWPDFSIHSFMHTYDQLAYNTQLHNSNKWLCHGLDAVTTVIYLLFYWNSENRFTDIQIQTTFHLFK